MAIIAFHISQENRADDVHIDWAIVAFHEITTAKVEDEVTKQLVDVDTWHPPVDVSVSAIRAVAPTWVKHTDLRGMTRVKFTDKDFGVIITHEELWDFCKGEIDKLSAVYTIKSDQRLEAVG